MTSKYVLDKYCPITPIQNNCTPLTKTIIHASDGQPAVGSPYTNVFIIINTIAKNAITQNIIPNIDDNISGVVENAVIPSKAYLNNFQKDHFVSPATLSIFSYSSHFVSNPTKLNNPFEYLKEIRKIYFPCSLNFKLRIQKRSCRFNE